MLNINTNGKNKFLNAVDNLALGIWEPVKTVETENVCNIPSFVDFGTFSNFVECLKVLTH